MEISIAVKVGVLNNMVVPDNAELAKAYR